MDELTTFPSPVEPGQHAWFSSLSALAERPGKLLELIEREFIVTRPWPDLGPRGVSNRPVLLVWQVGTRGLVTCVQFDGDKWWVEVEIEDVGQRCKHLEVDEMYPKIPLQMFLRCTAAVDPYRPPLLPEAANDA